MVLVVVGVRGGGSGGGDGGDAKGDSAGTGERCCGDDDKEASEG